MVHFDLHLVRAWNAVEAYDKALRIGGGKAKQYLGEDGGLVSFIFRGLNDLVMVEEGLEDGSRILFRTQPEMVEQEIQHVVTPREYLRALRVEGFDEGSGTVQ